MKRHNSVTDATGLNITAARLSRSCAAKALSVLFVLILPHRLQAEDYTYTTNGGMITITKYIGSGGAVTIPDTISGLPVTTLGFRSFMGCTSVTSVTIRDSVTNIQNAAFQSCADLTTVSIGNAVTTIGDDAFSGCGALNSVAIPDSVTSLGAWVFYYCSDLTNATLGGSISAIGDRTFTGCHSLTGIAIPSSVTRIGEYAFAECWSLGTLTIGTNVTSIGDYAFYRCHSLPSVSIPASVTNIGDFAFSRCLILDTMSVDSLNSFYGSLDGVLFNKSKTLLIQCPPNKSGSYAVPDGVTTIGDDGFAWGNVTSVAMPTSVTHIGASAFNECWYLSSAPIPPGVTNMLIRRGQRTPTPG